MRRVRTFWRCAAVVEDGGQLRQCARWVGGQRQVCAVHTRPGWRRRQAALRAEFALLSGLLVDRTARIEDVPTPRKRA